MSSPLPSPSSSGDSSWSGIWKKAFPPLNARSFLSHYLPVSGAVSHTMFSVHIFSPTIVSRLFPVGEFAVSNTILFNANLGIGFYVFFRNHMHRLNSWDRVEFSVLASTMFNFGSLLAAVLVKALLPNKASTVTKSIVATSLSVWLLTRGFKYLRHIDSKTVRSPRSSRNGSLKNGHVISTLPKNGSLDSPTKLDNQMIRGASPVSPIPRG